MNTELLTPSLNPIVVHKVATNALWLDGIEPVLQKRSSSSSLTEWTFPEQSLIRVLMNCAASQLLMQDRRIGFFMKSRKLLFTGIMHIFYLIIKICLVMELILVSFYNQIMEWEEFSVSDNDQNRRLDKILKVLMKGKPVSAINKAIRSGLVKVNGKKCQNSLVLKQGDTIRIASFLLAPAGTEQNNSTSVPESNGNSVQNLDIIFENQHLAFISKPQGLLSQNSRKGQVSVATLAKKMFASKNSISFTPAPLHRLDKGTTGLMAISKSTAGAQTFTRQMQEHQIRKFYLGIVEGHMDYPQEWKDFIADSLGERKGFHTVTVRNGDIGFNAVTKAVPLATGFLDNREITLVQFEITGGRKHQIRAGSSFHGFPLLGDTAYGSTTPNTSGFFLHAAMLLFKSPEELELPSRIQCPLPPEFSSFLKTNLLNWDMKFII